MKRLVLGLAGGVSSGKSTVAALFKKWGARVVDADALGHQVLQRPEIRRRLAREWGSGIMHRGRVDRAALASLVFRSKSSIRKLNRIVHPVIRRRIRRELKTSSRRGVVLDAALLFENGLDRVCDATVFVHAPASLRRRRAAARGWNRGEVARREKHQWPPFRKEKLADFVINNSGRRALMERRARKIFETVFLKS